MKRLQNLKILVVDDEPEILEVFSSLLTLSGATVFTASNGIEAIKTFHLRPDIQVIITDATMPGDEADGLTLARNIKKSNPNLLIFMLSGHHEKVEEEARQIGIDYLLPKPFRIKEIIALIETRIQLA